jgi:Tol biopolymer transport system component
VYGSPAGGSANLWVVNADGSAREKLTTNQDPKIRYLSPHWSPDEQQLAYLVQTNAQPTANEPAWELRRFALAQKTEARLLQIGAFPRLLGWLNQTQILLALVHDVNRDRAYPTTVELFSVDAASGHQTRLARLEETYLLTTTLSPDGRNLSFVKTHGDEQSVWRLSLANGRAGIPQELPATKSRAYLAGLAWAPDSKSLYYGLQTTTNFLTVIAPLKK